MSRTVLIVSLGLILAVTLVSVVVADNDLRCWCNDSEGKPDEAGTATACEAVGGVLDEGALGRCNPGEDEDFADACIDAGFQGLGCVA